MHFVATVAPLTKKARFLRKLCALTLVKKIFPFVLLMIAILFLLVYVEPLTMFVV